jgi:RecA-family ATPase
MTVAIDILKAFSEEPPPFDMVIPGMLAGSVGFIMSPGGAGKSMLALQIACGIASGTPEGDLIGFKPKRGKTLYLAAEDPEIAIWHRLHNMGKRFGAETRQAIAESLQVFSLVGAMPNIMEKEWHDWIMQNFCGYRMIIIDTLTRFHTLDENSNSDMSQLVSLLERIAKVTGSSILVIHHSSKSMAVQGRGDEQQAARGASALIDNARWAGNLTGMSVEEAKKLAAEMKGNPIGDDRGFYVRFSISKQNHGMPFPPLWLTRAEGGVLVRVSLYEAAKKSAKREERV